MSNERIDHAGEAERALHIIDGIHGTDMSLDETIAAAQVHATLALVEQQRIANLIALSVKQPTHGGGEVWISSYGPNGILRPEIREALGL